MTGHNEGAARVVSGLFVACGFAYILALTSQHNLGIAPDSVTYIELARNLLAGQGLQVRNEAGTLEFVNHWPPLYSLALAATAKLLGQDPAQAASGLGALLLALNILLSNMLFRLVSKSVSRLVAFNLFLFISLPFIVHLAILSEALFIFLVLASAYAFARSLALDRTSLMVLSGTFMGLAMVTRYAGAGFSVGFALFILATSHSIPKRFLLLVAFACPALAVLGVWVGFAIAHASDATGRELVFHLVSLQHLLQLVKTPMRWLSPSFPPLGAAIFVLLSILPFTSAGRIAWRDLPPQLHLVVTLVVCYVGFLLVSVSLFDFHTPLDNRILAPLFPFVLMLATYWVGACFLDASRPHVWRVGMLALVAIVFGSQAYHFSKRSMGVYQRGLQLSQRCYTESPAVKLAQENYSDGKIYSNACPVFRLMVAPEMGCSDVPHIYDPKTTLKNVDFEDQLSEVERSVRKGGLLVMLNSFSYRDHMPRADDLRERFAGLDHQMMSIDGCHTVHAWECNSDACADGGQ